MKLPRQPVGKAGTKGAKVTSEPHGLTIKPFPVRLFDANGCAPHDLGEILTPAQMATKVPSGGRWKEMPLEDAAEKALDALIGYGPQQPAPHLYTLCVLEKGIRGLRDFALAGDNDAMNTLGYLLTQAVGDLGEMARRHPKIVREWSRKQNVVPVLTGKNVEQTGSKNDVGELRRILDAFDVGAATPYQINPTAKRGGRTINAFTPVNRLAAHLCDYLAHRRYSTRIMKSPVPKWAQMASALPELTKATARQWADAAWECYMSATGSQPEKYSNLGKERASEGPGAERQKIRQSLREAMMRIARKRE